MKFFTLPKSAKKAKKELAMLTKKQQPINTLSQFVKTQKEMDAFMFSFGKR